MPQATWAAMAAEQPVGGPCNFSQSPLIDRYSWHATNLTLVFEGETTTQQFYSQIGIKKKSFCGSLDYVKPSLSIDIDRNVAANLALANAQVGTTRLSLENSKQDPDLFRQCAGYYIFRAMGLPAPMCTFAALYRRDTTTSPLVFLGLYVLTEPVKKDFFRRRAAFQNVPNGSLYEFEVPDDFTPATISQLQVEWSATSAQDFQFGVNQVQSNPGTALAKTLALPPFIDFWATEIFLKHWDGLTNNHNNTFVFDDPPGNLSAPITQTHFRFVPHGVDQILSTTKPIVYLNSVLAQLAYNDDGLRYQLIRTLGSMGDRVEAADVPAHVDSFVPLVVRLWRGSDTFFGADPNHAIAMAEHVRLAAHQAIVDARTVFGHGLRTPQTNVPSRLVGLHHVKCLTRVPSLTSFEIGYAACTNPAGQSWVFEPAAATMVALGFQDSLNIYNVRNLGTTRCLSVGAAFTDASGRFKLEIATCNSTDAQRFYLVQREGRSFELRSFSENLCAHFSDVLLTNDGRPMVYLAACDGVSKNLIVAE